MMATDEEALICDLAETYGIYNMMAFKPSYIGILAAGLRDDSRIKMKLAGVAVTTQDFLFGMMVDKLSNLVWMLSQDGAEGKNQPVSFVKILAGKTEESKDSGVIGYKTPEEFEAAMRKYER